MSQIPGSNQRSPNLTAFKIDINSATTTAIAAATAGMKGRLYKLVIAAGAAGTIIIKDGATALTGAISLATGTPLVLDFDGEPWFTTSANSALNITTTAVQFSGVAYYTLAP